VKVFDKIIYIRNTGLLLIK